MSTTGDPSTSEYFVDPNHSRSPRAFHGAENLWKADLRRLYRLVKKQIDLLEAEKESTRQKREERSAGEMPHLSIAIFGPSGSGKSSLLRTLHDDVQRDGKSLLKDMQLNSKVFCMPVMDPTTWAKNDQFLYAFLAAALEEDREEQKRSQHSYRQGLSPVQIAFQEVNEYLRVLDEAPASEEHDPLGLSLQRLERHTSGLRLRKALSDFVDQLCKQLGARVILLPVDDLDMAPHHLVDSLHAYQSYLTHPRLVPVFTFTDRMSEELIEAYHDRRLGSHAVSAASEGSVPRSSRVQPATVEGVEQRLTISQQLALQFLARCFPVRNRIRLGPAPARVQRATWEYSPDHERKGEEDHDAPERLPVLELLTVASFLLLGHPDEETAHTVSAALRPSTLRRQLQVFDAMVDCRLGAFRAPQLLVMASGGTDRTKDGLSDRLERLAGGKRPESKGWEAFEEAHAPRLHSCWDPGQKRLLKEREEFFSEFGKKLQNLEIGATWATIFNGAAWSLLNVHRDTLRELGLYLEDLYSWSPVELRSYVLANLLSRDRMTRRTVVDRWFNRADSRRSQVLSLLAANVFRPWMYGEEPYGDEERAVREWLKLEEEAGDFELTPIDYQWKKAGSGKPEPKRFMFPATDGLRWFLNVTLGFYLPLVMARDWSDALSSDEPVRVRMSGSGWDLHHAPINAVRIADAKREILSFGMHFLDPTGYRKALEAIPEKKDGDDSPPGKEPTRRGHLLLRIWSCCGYSRGRYWAAISLWRGLGFIGRVLEKWAEYSESIRQDLGLEENGKYWKQLGEKGKNPQEEKWEKLEELKARAEGREIPREAKEALAAKLLSFRDDLRRLIRSHCLSGLVPGSLLGERTTEDDLLQGFPRWAPETLEEDIKLLANELADWLTTCRDDFVLPFPVGDVWIGWKDCFIRRIHGEYIMGSLWPHLHAAYLEAQVRYENFQKWAKKRSADNEDVGLLGIELSEEDNYRWTAAVAGGAWSDLLLEYWRGCPPILRLLLLCPIFIKSNERFGESPTETKEKEKVDRGTVFKWLRQDPKEILGDTNLENLDDAEVEEEVRKTIAKEVSDSNSNEATRSRYKWLKRLSVPREVWVEFTSPVGEMGTEVTLRVDKALVCNEFCIERPLIDRFSPPFVQHHGVSVEGGDFELELQGEGLLADGKRQKTKSASGKLLVKVRTKAKESEEVSRKNDGEATS